MCLKLYERYAFLSSTVKYDDDRLALKNVRKELCDVVGVNLAKEFFSIDSQTLVYTDEILHNWEKDKEKKEDLFYVDRFLTYLRYSEIFICILGNKKHGTRIKVKDKESVVSFWEIELYQAALVQKPIYIFVRKGMLSADFEEELQKTLEILQFAFPKTTWQEFKNEDDLCSQIEKILRYTFKDKDENETHAWLDKFKDTRIRLVEELDRKRGKNTKKENILFMEDRFERGLKPADKDFIKMLIDECQHPKNLIKGDRLNTEQCLSRLWMIWRELRKSPYTKNYKNYKEYLPLWNDFFGLWNKSASWYGLHGHLYMGVLASLNALNIVRTIIRESGNVSPNIDFSHPGGALASANYSLAKLITIPERKIIYFQDAERHIDISLKDANDPLYRSNLLAIRGSIYAQMASCEKLVKPIYYGLKALSDYKNVLSLREKHGAEEGAIGEAMTELGFLEFHMPLSYKKKIGLKRMKEGVELLKSRKGKGFYVRAIRKLSFAYKKTGKLEEAKKLEDDAHKLAHDEALIDQLAQLPDKR